MADDMNKKINDEELENVNGGLNGTDGSTLSMLQGGVPVAPAVQSQEGNGGFVIKDWNYVEHDIEI